MSDVLGIRTAPIIAVLAEMDRPLRLAELARLAEAPLSSAQRAVQGLLDDGLVVRIEGPRPAYRLAPDAPRRALADLAAWKLGELVARQVQQRAAAAAGPAQPIASIDDATAAALHDPTTRDRLETMARCLIWWEPPETTLRQPVRLVQQAMAIGDWDEATFITDLYGDDRLREALAASPPGVFGPASWSYWHKRLGYRKVPPRPVRVVD